MFIAISQYKKPLPEVDLHRDAHRAYIKPYFSDGRLLAGGRQNPPSGGIIITKHATRAEFEEILKNDPFVKAGVAHYQIFEFQPHFYDACLQDLFVTHK